MKNTVFLLIAIFVYVDAYVYTITTTTFESQDERILSISDSYPSESSDANITCPDGYVTVRREIQDTPLYDGFGIYADTEVKKSIQLCNNDITELSGTISCILLSALGVDNDDEIACPLAQGITCLQKKFKMVSGNFVGVFENDTTDATDATLDIRLPNLLTAQFSISKEGGLLVPESVTDSSADEKEEMQKEIDEAEEEAGAEEAQKDEENSGDK